MTSRILDFSIGPVQGFVSQARRTRDLWAGSFLLSWLSGRAMQALRDHGTVLFPMTNGDPLHQALEQGGRGPRIGSLPNRFKARIDKDVNAGELCRKAVDDAWKGLAELVWTNFVETAAIAHGHKTRAIWDMQIGGFWEIMWTIQNEESYLPSALDARKNWRSHAAPDEAFGSDHCMLMPDWQELSGHARARRVGRQSQEDFWQRVRGNISQALYNDAAKSNLELRETERLCAMALIKRLFPVLFDVDDLREAASQAIGFIPGDPSLRTLRNWRSTAHIAASPWMVALRDASESQVYGRKLKEFAKDNLAEGVLFSEPAGVVGVLSGNPLERADGRLFYSDAIVSRRADSWGEPVASDASLRRELAAALSILTKPYGEPTRFYAVLVMDGDRLGAELAKDPARSGPEISGCLARFTAKVNGLSQNANHVLIYAGGDDVLGLFPITEVLAAARTYRGFYEQSFAGYGIETTISGAIIVAPYDAPLSRSIAEAHKLLDDVAKDANGRDSLALAVSKSAGGQTSWVSKWGDNCARVSAFEALIDQFRAEGLSSSYLHKLERNYGSALSEETDPEVLRARLLSEWLVGKDRLKPEVRDQAECLINLLTDACCTGPSGTAFTVDGALSARFLAKEWRP